MSLIVRRARPEDQLACAQVFVETVAATFPDEPEEGRSAGAYVTSIIGEEQWVALHDRRIIALISIYWQTNFIHSLYVLPAYQGRGVGRTLLAEVQRLARGDMELKTDKANSRAFEFYRHLGWRVVGEGATASGPWWRMRAPGGVL